MSRGELYQETGKGTNQFLFFRFLSFVEDTFRFETCKRVNKWGLIDILLML